ncbi:MAG: hypothetical protein AAFW81_05890 [Pseudomonadota bacterium]
MSKSIKAGVLGVAFAFAAASPALAVPLASYNASIEATLSLTGVSVDSGTGDADVDILGDAFIIVDDAFAVGDASSSTGGAGASPAGFVPLASDPIMIDISANGSATGIGFADSIVSADGLVDIVNNSIDNTVKLDFELSYSVAADASVTDALLQEASAIAFLELTNSQEFDPLLTLDLFADTFFLEPGGALTDIFMFSIFIEPLGGATLSLLADVSGVLTSDLEATIIPIPAAAPLFGFGALVLLLKSRRRRS